MAKKLVKQIKQNQKANKAAIAAALKKNAGTSERGYKLS